MLKFKYGYSCFDKISQWLEFVVLISNYILDINWCFIILKVFFLLSIFGSIISILKIMIYGVTTIC